jgi:hypothetical protein
MTNTHQQRRLAGRQEGLDREGQVDYEELRVGSTRLASCEDLDSFESLTEVWICTVFCFLRGICVHFCMSRKRFGCAHLYNTKLKLRF